MHSAPRTAPPRQTAARQGIAPPPAGQSHTSAATALFFVRAAVQIHARAVRRRADAVFFEVRGQLFHHLFEGIAPEVFGDKVGIFLLHLRRDLREEGAAVVVDQAVDDVVQVALALVVEDLLLRGSSCGLLRGDLCVSDALALLLFLRGFFLARVEIDEFVERVDKALVDVAPAQTDDRFVAFAQFAHEAGIVAVARGDAEHVHVLFKEDDERLNDESNVDGVFAGRYFELLYGGHRIAVDLLLPTLDGALRPVGKDAFDDDIAVIGCLVEDLFGVLRPDVFRIDEYGDVVDLIHCVPLLHSNKPAAKTMRFSRGGKRRACTVFRVRLKVPVRCGLR